MKTGKKGPVNRKQDTFKVGGRVKISGGEYVPYKSLPHLFAEVKTFGSLAEGCICGARKFATWNGLQWSLPQEAW